MREKLDIKEAKAILHKLGYRVTKQREEILKILDNSCHPTPDDVIDTLKKRKIKFTVATVYNTLEALSNEGLIKKISGLESKNHYDVFLDNHYHGICMKCKKIYDIYIDFNKINLPEDFTITDCLLQGLCNQCKEK